MKFKNTCLSVVLTVVFLSLSAQSREYTSAEKKSVLKSFVNVVFANHYLPMFRNQGSFNKTKEQLISNFKKFVQTYYECIDEKRVLFLESDILPLIKDDQQVFKDFIAFQADTEKTIEQFRKMYEVKILEMLKWINGIQFESLDFNVSDPFYRNNRDAWAKNPEELQLRRIAWMKSYLLRKDGSDLRKVKNNFSESIKALNAYYEKKLHADSEMQLEYILNSFSKIYDPHTVYMGPKFYNQFMSSSEFGNYLTLGFLYKTVPTGIRVTKIIEGSYLEKNKKLNVGDIIVTLSNSSEPDSEKTELAGLSIDEVSKLFSQIKKNEKRFINKLTRRSFLSFRYLLTEVEIQNEEIYNPQHFVSGQIVQTTTEDGSFVKIGIVNIPSFYGKFTSHPTDQEMLSYVSVHVSSLVEEFKQEGTDIILLDLRDNPGGYLGEVIKLVALFLGDSFMPVTQVKDGRGRIQVLRTDIIQSQQYLGPLVVVINKKSASASEIFAAAMQVYSRALIIGESKTFGKASVQSLYGVKDFTSSFYEIPRLLPTDLVGILKVTIQKYFRITGQTTQNEGVIPDIIWPAFDDGIEKGETGLPNALKPEQISKIYFKIREKFITPQILNKLKTNAVENNQQAFFENEIKKINGALLKLRDLNLSKEPTSVAEKKRLDVEMEKLTRDLAVFNKRLSKYLALEIKKFKITTYTFNYESFKSGSVKFDKEDSRVKLIPNLGVLPSFREDQASDKYRDRLNESNVFQQSLQLFRSVELAKQYLEELNHFN